MARDSVAQAYADTGERIRSDQQLDRPLPEELARLHNGFERIHPFLDGNGRAGRLLLNLILVRLGHPPVIIFKRQRDAYLTALQRADAGDYGALAELIARAMYDNLNRFIVPNVAGPARLVPLTALVTKDFSLPARSDAPHSAVVSTRCRGRTGYGAARARPWTRTGPRGTNDSREGRSREP